MFIVIGKDSCFSASDDYSMRDVERVPLRSAKPEELEGLAKRLHDRTLADGQQLVARGLPYLFGRATCPDCGTACEVADRIAARWML
ncbi:hypothetical protein ACFY0A_41220 [Streptomyces sp. NPDC001698]|uniref:hypothetical protein n=1 Tax=unclassified Streptomyces TaxID=2593676 RepID=UPI00368F262B